MKIPLDNKTILVNDSIDSVLRCVNRVGRRGIDMRLYTVGGDSDREDVQTVVTFLNSMKNPNPIYRRSRKDVDKLIGDALDRVLISDRVRSCSSFYTTNNKDSDRSNSLVVDFDGQREN